MSYLDLDQLTAQGLIVQYVVECRGKGFFLPYTDYEIIQTWLQSAADVDELLLILSEILPEFYAKKAATNAHPPSLAAVQRRVGERLRDIKMRRLAD